VFIQRASQKYVPPYRVLPPGFSPPSGSKPYAKSKFSPFSLPALNYPLVLARINISELKEHLWKKVTRFLASGKKLPRREENKKEPGIWWEIAIIVVRDEIL
jgi:hypothetical protein